MHPALIAIQAGWAVYDTADEMLGEVEEVEGDCVRLRAGPSFPAGLYVPADAIIETDEAQSRVYLNVTCAAAVELGWDVPPVEQPEAPPEEVGRRTFDYGITARDRAGTVAGNLSGEVMGEAEARVQRDDVEDPSIA